MLFLVQHESISLAAVRGRVMLSDFENGGTNWRGGGEKRLGVFYRPVREKEEGYRAAESLLRAAVSCGLLFP